MSKKISRTLLIIEAIIISTPLSILALIVSYLHITDMFQFYKQYHVVLLGVLALISLAAIVSGWRLFVAFITGGTIELRRQPLFWWFMIIAGVMVLIGSLISVCLPPSDEYTRWWSFRIDFELYLLSAPLLIPLVHLALERFVRNPDSEKNVGSND